MILSTEKILEWPHYESCKDIRLKELNVSSSTNERVTTIQGRVKIDVAAHEHSLVVRTFWGLWPTYLVHTVIKHLQESHTSFWVVKRSWLARLNPSRVQCRAKVFGGPRRVQKYILHDIFLIIYIYIYITLKSFELLYKCFLNFHSPKFYNLKFLNHEQKVWICNRNTKIQIFDWNVGSCQKGKS